MGLYTRVTGKITIDPPLSHAEIRRAANFVPAAGHSWAERDVIIQVNVEVRTTDEGELHVTRGTAIVGYEDTYKAYHIEEHLTELSKMFSKEHTFLGHLYGAVETGEFWRASIDPSGARLEYAKLMWPDGTTCDPGDLS